MAENSKIEWTDHTFNLGWGCVKKSPGCAQCYAERDSKRYGFDVWGKKKPRRLLSIKYHKKPLVWNEKALALGKRHRVFCGSMMDWTDDDWFTMLPYLWSLWRDTPNLDWLMLTKNEKKLAACLPPDWSSGYDSIWLGVSVENQEMADLRIPELLKIPAKVRFLSCEPLLEKIDIAFIPTFPGSNTKIDVLGTNRDEHPIQPPNISTIHWVIVGGESGPRKRYFDPDWARSIRDQCKETGVKFFMKQMNKIDPIPPDLMIREFPNE